MKKRTEQNKRTNDKYFKCFTDMYSRPEFDAIGMRKAHNVSAILVTILADFGYLTKLGTARYSWKKSMGQPTKDLADTIRKEATVRWHASQHKRRKKLQEKDTEGGSFVHVTDTANAYQVIDDHKLPEHSLKFPDWNIPTRETDKQLAAQISDDIIVAELKKRGYKVFKMTEL